MRSGKTLSGYARALAAVFVSSAKTRSRHPSLLAWRNYSSQSFGASSILLLKAAGKTYMHPKFLPAVICAPSQTVLFPGSERRQG
jgi:hypothetical protein